MRGLAVALAVLPSLAACWDPGAAHKSSSGGGTAVPPKTTPPVIDSLDLPASVTPSPLGPYYVVNGSITYHDDDDVIESGGVYVPVIGKTIPITIPPAEQQSFGAGIPFVFQVSDDIPLGRAGPTTFVVTLTNKSGAVSPAWKASIDLQ